MRLEVDVPGIERSLDVVDGFRVHGITHIDNAETLREHVANIGEASIDHELHAVSTAALIAVSDQPHVADVVRPAVDLCAHGRRSSLCWCRKWSAAVLRSRSFWCFSSSAPSKSSFRKAPSSRPR